jgi:IS605 OrfB family transposase
VEEVGGGLDVAVQGAILDSRIEDVRGPIVQLLQPPPGKCVAQPSPRIEPKNLVCSSPTYFSDRTPGRVLRSVFVRLRYNYRLYPTPGQRIALAKAFGCARVVFNDGLRVRQATHAAGLPYVKDADLQRQVITQAKKTTERAWLAEVSSVVLVQALRDLHTAYRNFFGSLVGDRKGARVAPPRFRSKRDGRQAIRLTRNGFRLRSNGRLFVAKIGEIEVRWSRPLPTEPSSVTVIKDRAGRYFASFVVDVVAEPLPPTGRAVGIDLGLSHFVVLSDGRKISSPRFLRRAERKLKRAQRALSRTEKGSGNRAKARARVARQHAKVADQRREFHHQLSSYLIRDNQAVYVEDLAVQGLARTRLAKSVYDAGWAAFVSMLESKADRSGRGFARVDRAFPSSQLCSACGYRDGPKPLGVRTWICRRCGVELDRDINAARNILREGCRISRSTVAAGRQAATAKWRGAETLNACGDPVGPSFVVARVVEPGTHQRLKAE